MLRYVSLMVYAYSDATGEPIETALKDLAFDSFVSPHELSRPTDQEYLSALSKDKPGVLSWAENANREGGKTEILRINHK